jgi:cell division protein FtsL
MAVAVRTTTPRDPVARAREVDAARPELRVVPGRRRTVGLLAVIGALVFALLLGVTAFQTRLAQHQLELDRTERAVAAERERFDQLRLERAELRAPARLAAEAAALGMVPGTETEFVTVAPGIVEEVLVATGGVDPSIAAPAEDPFAAYGAVKAQVGATP